LVPGVGFVGEWSGSGGGEIVSDGLLFIHVQTARVSPDKALVEDASGELVEVFFFESTQHAGAYFRRQGDFLEGDALLLALLS
jgi:hypothetical protein